MSSTSEMIFLKAGKAGGRSGWNAEQKVWGCKLALTPTITQGGQAFPPECLVESTGLVTLLAEHRLCRPGTHFRLPLATSQRGDPQRCTPISCQLGVPTLPTSLGCED